jgi:predicted aldo/keto reductase-like oxidoreductase
MPKDKPSLSRRQFIKTGAAASAGALLAGTANSQTAQAAVNPADMPLRPFGKTGRNVSILSMGGMYDIVNNQMQLRQALRLGVTYWDTAHTYGYGRSEAGMGKYLGSHPDLRPKIFLVTKSTKRSPDGWDAELAESLERLQTSHVDLFFVHAINDIDDLSSSARDWSLRAKEAGKIKLFGFSTHSNMAECLKPAADMDFIDGMMFTYNYRLMHRREMNDAVQACHDAGKGLTAMKTMGGGPVRVDSDAELEMAGRFVKKGFSDAQAKLKAIWEDKRIAAICSQMPNLSYLMANAAAAMDKTKLSRTDHRLLAEQAQQTACGYCAGCSNICHTALNNTVPVQTIMRSLMYHRDYNDLELARQTYGELPARTRHLLAKTDYSPAEDACPQGLPIAKLIGEAEKILGG